VNDWPVQRRLLAVIVLALIMGLVFGGLRFASAVSTAEQAGRAAQLARLGQQSVMLIQDLENERDQTAGVIAGASPMALRSLTAVTDKQAATVGAQASAIGAGFPANIRSEAGAVESDATSLSAVRSLAQGNGPPTNVLDNYAAPIGDLIQLDDQIAQGVSDSDITEDVRGLTALAQAQEEVSEQRALLFNTFTLGSFADGSQAALNSAMNQEQLDEASFQAAATPAQLAAVSAVLTGTPANTISNVEQVIQIDGSPFTNLGDVGITGSPAPQTYQLESAKLVGVQSVETGIVDDIVSRTASLEGSAQANAGLTGIGTLLALLLVLAAAVAVARSLVRPLERLRAGALEIATVELPERMRRLGEADGTGADLDIVPINVTSRDEIGQVARAFDQVHQEAVRLAGNEAMLRGSFNAMFVNLSRRSQVLIERLARQIDSLEQNEADPERLAELFSMDHLVTRMRRNSENLLLLAGHEGGRQWDESAPLADVARAAASEIEQFGRVKVRVPSGITVAGEAVSDIARLLAELIENATTFSPADTPVRVVATEPRTGGVLIEVADAGVGISAERMAELNERLERPPVVDVQVARHMGLYAVGRLAERHGAKVRLRAGTVRGTVVLVWLPDSLIEPAPLIRRVSPARTGLAQDLRDPESSPGRLSAHASASMTAAATGSAHTPAGAAVPSAVSVSSSALSSSPYSLSGAGRGGLGQASAGRGGLAQSGAGRSGQRPASRWFGTAARGGARGSRGDLPRQQLVAGQSVVGQPAGGPPAWTPPGPLPAPTEQTRAGLPVRVPQASLPPGISPAGGAGSDSAGSDSADSDSARSDSARSDSARSDSADPRRGASRGYVPGRHATERSSPRQRSPEQARSTLSGFQRGSRRAKDAGPGAGEGAGR
jgi:signal transduction histidine kinase